MKRQRCRGCKEGSTHGTDHSNGRASSHAARDRAGIRIPTLAVSAYIDPGTVVTSEYRNISLIRTLRERWPLGPPLTARDVTAADIAPVLARSTPRPQEDWPEVTSRPMPQLKDTQTSTRIAAAWRPNLASQSRAHGPDSLVMGRTIH